MLTLRIGCQKSINFKSAERKIKSLQENLITLIRTFCDRRQKIHPKLKQVIQTAGKKDDYDGTDDTLRTDSVGHVPSQELKKSLSGKDRDLSNRPDGYKRWG